MLDSEQTMKWDKQTEQRIYTVGVVVTLVMLILALILALLNTVNTSSKVGAIIQFSVCCLVFGFTVFSDKLVSEGFLKQEVWERCAVICAGMVILTSLFTGEYFNVILMPLLVSIGQRRDDHQLIIKLGAGAVLLTALEFIGFYLFRLERQALGGAATSVTAIAALTLSLSTFIQRYQTQVKKYQDEAATKASEMEIAHEIQTSLMPPNSFSNENWSLAARSIPAKDVGGDFYEYVQHPHLEQTISGIAIGDVAGKGIPAALQMAVVRTLFRVEARRRIFPGETLQSVNAALQAERSFGMVTMLYAFLDDKTNTLHLSNAGHNYPIVLDGAITEIKMPGLPLGIDDGIEYEEKLVKIKPGSSVIFYTDGVTEAMDTTGQLYAYERFRKSIEAHQHLEPMAMVDSLLADIAVFTEGANQSDDITVLVLNYHPKVSEVTTPAVAVGKPSVEPEDDGINWI